MDEISGHQGLKFPFIQIGVHALDLQAAFCEGARFVETDHVAVGEVFQRMQLPHQYVFLGQPEHAHRKADADEQHQPLRQHPQKASRSGDYGSVHRCAALENRLRKQQHTQRHDEKAGKFCDLFHRGEQLGAAAFVF